MKVDDYNKLTDEEKKQWLGTAEPRVYWRNGEIIVYRYQSNRPLSANERDNRFRFAKAASETFGIHGLAKYKGKLLPKASIKLARLLKRVKPE